MLKTNIVLFVWSILFQFGIYLGNKVKFTVGAFRKNSDPIAKGNGWTDYDKKIPILTILAVLVTLYRVYNVGIINLLARGTSSFAASENASLAVLIEKIMMAVVYFAFIYSAFEWREKKRIAPLIITGVCLLLSYFPTSAARNAVAGLYFGAMIALFPKMRKNSVFVLLYSLIFMIVFPLFNAFRTVAFTNVDVLSALGSTLSNFSSGWLAVDYDAYSMVALTLKYISLHGITYGRQLLGVFLFWIPRSIWPGKPEGSGPVVAEYFGWWFTNVSEPLPAEMLINFGIIGMAILAIICGLIIGKLDNMYWKDRPEREQSIKRYDSLYLYMIGYFLFLYRGALLSAVAYLVAFVVVWWFFSSDIFRLRQSNVRNNNQA